METDREEVMRHARALAVVYLARRIGGDASASFIDEVLAGKADDHPSIRPFVERAKQGLRGPFESKIMSAAGVASWDSEA